MCLELNLILGKQNIGDKCKKMYDFHGKSLETIIQRSEKVEILSSQGENLATVEIVWKNGSRIKFRRETCRTNQGTVVTVHNLAYDRLDPYGDRVTDFKRLIQPIKEIALINPLVSFTALNIQDNKIIISESKTNNILSRFESNFGTMYSKYLKRLHYEENNFQMNGIISLKSTSSTKDLQFFYINKHLLRHQNKIYKYVEDVYGKYVLYGPEKWPVYIINLKCPINYNEVDCEQLSTSFTVQKIIDFAFKSHFERKDNNQSIKPIVQEMKSPICKNFDIQQIRGVVCSDIVEREIKKLTPVKKDKKKSVHIHGDILRKIESLQSSPKSMSEIIMEKFLKSVIIVQELGEEALMLDDSSSSSTNKNSVNSCENKSIKSITDYSEEEAIFKQHLENITNKRKIQKQNDEENKLPSPKSEKNKRLCAEVAVETNKTEDVLMKSLEKSLKSDEDNNRFDSESQTFKLKQRCFYLPKGMSQPISREETVTKIKILSPESKKKLHTAIFPNYPGKKNFDFEQCFEEDYNRNKPISFDVNNIMSKVQSKTGRNLLRNLNSITFTKELFDNCKFIGQIDNKFIATICKVDKSELIVLFDQHAVHERIRLENLLEEFKTNENGHLLKSTKIKEIQLELNYFVIARVKVTQQQLIRLGFNFDIRKKTILIKTIPTCLISKIYNFDKLFCEIVDEIDKSLRISKELQSIPKCLHDMITSLACRGAIKFGDPLNNLECENILKQLSKCTMPFQCAHGRPSLMPIFDMTEIN